MKPTFPGKILSQHIAVLGKTGSGKTSTAKLIVEQLVAHDPNARICILDPIKSDHWGLTRAANGKDKGLPFCVLGGPYGHVPLSASAGMPIGQVVASGAGRMLRALAEAYPSALTKEELGVRASISHGSGTFGTYLSTLRTLELIEGKSEITASREFFE